MSSPAAHLRTVFSSDGATILDPQRDSFVRLNPTGSFIWHSLEAGKSLDDIADALALETRADPSMVANDVRDFVSQLQAQGLLQD